VAAAPLFGLAACGGSNDAAPPARTAPPATTSTTAASATTSPAIAADLAVEAGAADHDWIQVDQAIGRKGTDQPGGAHKYSFPRSDLRITVDGTPIKPALALGGWVAFQPMGTGAMFMGDIIGICGERFAFMAEDSCW